MGWAASLARLELAQRGVPLRPFTTMRVGGPAELFLVATSADELAEATQEAYAAGMPLTVLGSGSNVLPSDAGVPGLVLVNEARAIGLDEEGQLVAETGAAFQDVFLWAAQRGLAGLEFAVGIPGTIGGALVSNAGAYRSDASEFVTALEVVEAGERRWVGPEFMQFSYRDSRLRRPGGAPCTLVRVKMRLPKGDPTAIYREAMDYQRQRIRKQPGAASAGSFFKNVVNRRLAESLDDLSLQLRRAGVVPAGFLVERAGMLGYRLGGAQIAPRHGNFLLNVGGATASDVRRLSEVAKRAVRERFGVELEEEVLRIGDWSGWTPD